MAHCLVPVCGIVSDDELVVESVVDKVDEPVNNAISHNINLFKYKT